MDKETLKEMGMTSNEVEIYLTLLRAGSVTVNVIAEKSGLHRQAIYDALERLLDKGFVSYVQRNSKKHFQAIHPDKLVEHLHQKEEKLKLIMPELVALTHLSKEQTFVEVLKGKGILRTIFRDIIKTLENDPQEILISGVNENIFLEQDPVGMEQHLNRLQKLGCTEKVLVKEGDTNFVKGKQTIYRSIPEEYFSPNPIFVYKNHLTMLIPGEPQHAIIIENDQLSDSYRKQFNLLWKIAKPIKRN